MRLSGFQIRPVSGPEIAGCGKGACPSPGPPLEAPACRGSPEAHDPRGAIYQSAGLRTRTDSRDPSRRVRFGKMIIPETKFYLAGLCGGSAASVCFSLDFPINHRTRLDSILRPVDGTFLVLR
jgi:hypothetical protein